MKRTVEQERAAFALTKVKGVAASSTAVPAKYRTQLLKLPARLHTTGLGQTAAYLRAQSPSSAEYKIYQWLAEWLAERKHYPSAELIENIVGLGVESGSAEESKVAARYRPAAAEARAIATWLKRFAEAFLAEPDEAGSHGAEDAA